MFHYALRPRGILFLGSSENVSRHGELFSTLSKRWRIFERQNLVARPEVPFPMLTVLGSVRTDRPTFPNLPVGDAGPSLELVLRRIGALVQEQYGPAYVVANKDGEVIHYSGRTGKYLEPAEGPPNRDLLGMARKGLRPELRAALHQARELGEAVRRERVSVQINGGEQLLTLSVRPITDSNETLYLVVFSDVGSISHGDETKLERPADGADQGTVQQLERELQLMRERLQTTVEEFDTSSEELKSSNEELLSVNEELQSANEELETSKEEIQSINEELQTVNAEITNKVEELDHANADLKNLFESTQIATIMVEGDLTIRGFTPPIESVFNLIPSDSGRPLTHIVSRLDQPQIERDILAAIERGQPFERRVTSDAGRVHHLMRIIPFPGAGKKGNGALVTFVNVSNIVRAEEQEKSLLQELDHRVKNSLDTAAGIVERALKESDSLEEFAEQAPPRLAALARTHELVAGRNWTDVPLAALVAAQISPYRRLTSQREVVMRGPDIALAPHAALALGWTVHELAMHAWHGALAMKVDVAVRWAVVRWNRKSALEVRWLSAGRPTRPTAAGGWPCPRSSGDCAPKSVAQPNSPLGVPAWHARSGCRWRAMWRRPNSPPHRPGAAPPAQASGGEARRSKLSGSAPGLAIPALGKIGSQLVGRLQQLLAVRDGPLALEQYPFAIDDRLLDREIDFLLVAPGSMRHLVSGRSGGHEAMRAAP